MKPNRDTSGVYNYSTLDGDSITLSNFDMEITLSYEEFKDIIACCKDSKKLALVDKLEKIQQHVTPHDVATAISVWVCGSK